MLSADVIVEGDFGEGMRVGCVGGGGGLAVSEEGGNNYEELGSMFNGSTQCSSSVSYLLRIQRLVFTN